MDFFVSRLRQLGEPRLLLPVLGAFLLLVVWLSTLNGVSRDERRAVQESLRITERLTETYEAQTIRLLSDIGRTIQLIDYAVDRVGPASALQELQGRSLLPSSLFFTIRIVETTGQVLAASRPVDDRYPIAEKNLPAGIPVRGLHVAPAHADPQESEWIVDFMRPLTTEPGQPRLVAVVTVPVSFLVSDYDETRFGAHGVLAVIGQDGLFRAQRSGDRVSAGAGLEQPLTLPDDLDGRPRSVLMTAPWGGERYYMAGRQLPMASVTIVVALSESERMSSVDAAAHKAYADAAWVSALIVLGTLALTWMSVRVHRLRERSMAERAAHAQQIEHMVYHDALTGLKNRTGFHQQLQPALVTAQAQGAGLALLFLDLDGFKAVNDTLGHEAGDALLQQVAQRLTHALRQEDVVARLGGDEFIVLMPRLTDTPELLKIASRVSASIAEPYALPGGEGRVTASTGLAIYPRDGQDAETLLRHADQAMYRSKHAGKNRVTLYDAEASMGGN
jgi:diguanylate cyclase (GGDEF)-like protein